ncbi:MAG: hypothetical protein MJ208_04270 [Bacilli bacterium]|nr:hypothetical protein [Bacilli bacterium]
MKWEIRYYFDEISLNARRICFKEEIEAKEKNIAITLASHRLNHSAFGFKYYEIIEIPISH